jgi:NAD-dependent dihydropyrimidine dehydrogenase PreA subunit
MQLSKNDSHRLREVFDIPDFIEPWLDRFFNREEMFLVLLVADEPLKIDDIADRWTGAGRYRNLDYLQDFLDRSCKRGIVRRCDGDRFQAADFHERFDSWALFEGWMDLPADVRDRLNAWELENYSRRHQNQLNTLKKGGDRDPALVWPAYVLLSEAKALIDQADHIYLWPCNCRAMMGRCARNIHTCLRFSNHRGVGWQISKSRAKEIIDKANKGGLMQNAEISLNPEGYISGAICNCCVDCCFPHQLAQQQNAAKLWPLTRYVAGQLMARCTGCGNCVKRCPFGAFAYGDSKNVLKRDSIGTKKIKRTVHLDSSLCRGCGVCSTGCPENAIDMIRLEQVESAWERQLLNKKRDEPMDEINRG